MTQAEADGPAETKQLPVHFEQSRRDGEVRDV